jgi:putative membrane protein
MTNKPIVNHRFSRLAGTSLAGAFFLGITLSAQQTPAQTPSTDHRTKSFLEEASQGNLSEISMAKIAEQRSQNNDVKNLARTLRDDHQKAEQQVQQLAQERGVTLAQEPSSGDRHTKNKLGKTSGSEFDQDYTKDMLKDHVNDIKKFSKAAEDIKDPAVRQFAQSMVPKLQSHLQLAAQTARKVGVDQDTINSYLEKATGYIGTGHPPGNGYPGTASRP